MGFAGFVVVGLGRRRRVSIIVAVFAALVLASLVWTPLFAEMPMDALTGRVILLDPGHGGIDGGTSRRGILEKNLNLDISLKLKAVLEEWGAIVRMTREADMSLDKAGPPGSSRHRRDLGARLALEEAVKPDAFVSIHMNYAGSSRISGPVLFYGKGNETGRNLAEAILRELEEVIGPSDQGCLTKDLFVTRNAECDSSVLIEVGFMSNPWDLSMLVRPDIQERIARAVARGIAVHSAGTWTSRGLGGI